MLLLVFQLGSSRYAIDARQVVEVMPYVQLEPIAHAPRYAAGLLNFRGQLLPVIDLRQLTQDNACNTHMTTRIVLVDYPLPNGESRLLGLLAEQVTETVKRDRDSFRDSGIHIADTPYLSEVAQDDLGMIHYLEIQRLLPEEVCNMLFSPDAA